MNFNLIFIISRFNITEHYSSGKQNDEQKRFCVKYIRQKYTFSCISCVSGETFKERFNEPFIEDLRGDWPEKANSKSLKESNFNFCPFCICAKPRRKKLLAIIRSFLLRWE